MANSSDVRYASADDVLLALDKNPDSATDQLVERAEKRAAAATRTWINRTGRPFHPERVGDPDEPRSWEVHDVQDAESVQPVTVQLNNRRILPLDPEEGDELEVRTRRDTWRPITEDEGRKWTLNYRGRRLTIYRRRVKLTPFDDPNKRFMRITYRYGPLGEDVEIDEDGLVTSVPADVADAVAAKAASRLALDDELKRSRSNDGNLTDRSTKRSALTDEFEDTAAEYTGFSTI
ncbi:hypothetical protein [Natrarchaeobius oligotrophus]|uniref:Uncharacterized protein n=1 Tax=Natrarchaeobius chitinivorans TaxID=1679083 RepID=A0A3N6M0E3_NATCH|nr:hypothetical protein [Natrarchaeobius chitinivorans]RQG93734.1 hypothetical protein EA472_22635 [Natrarchaeobius chitinivorans]